MQVQKVKTAVQYEILISDQEMEFLDTLLFFNENNRVGTYTEEAASFFATLRRALREARRS